MGRGRGGGGGGRSSGGGSFGGSRSSGGSRGGSSSHRGGYSSGRSSSVRSSGPRSSYGPRPAGHRPPPPPHRRRSSAPPRYGPSGSSRRSSSGFLALIVMFVLVFVLIGVFNFVQSSPAVGVGITASTIEREPLAGQYVTTTDYYYDDAGWISSGSKLESGMKVFFKETGVQPYLYITETIDGDPNPSDAKMESFANDLYDELFEDEGHLLVVFQEYNSSGNYFCWCVAGKQAKTVFDSEARDIFFDYIDHYYYSDLDEEGFFSAAFEKTAERMMTKSKNPFALVLVGLVVLAVVIIGFRWWSKIKAQKNLEAEQTERILNADIDDLAKDPELAELEQKYE